jgi:murein DD-endopeptidase MepM/ murein hydrolase activator NlpD
MAIDPANSATGANLRQQRNDQLKKTCKEFESILTFEMLKSMRQTVDKCDLMSGGEGEEIYESLMDQELSKKMTGSGSNSLGELLYRQLSRIDSASRPDLTADSNKEVSSQAEKPVVSKLENNSSRADRTVISNLEDAASLADPAIDTVTQSSQAVSSAEDSQPEWPVKSAISSKFGWRRDPFLPETRFHSGIDIAAEKGTEIKAAMSGKVIMSCNMKGYGNVVAVDHGHGLVTIYAHNEKNLVKVGDEVKKGAFIAMVGSTGRSTGAHLHFEVRKDGGKINPLEFLGRA